MPTYNCTLREELKFCSAAPPVRAPPGCLSWPSDRHRQSSFCGAFVWAWRALNHPFRRFPAGVDRQEL
jgi:hypothetical protein